MVVPEKFNEEVYLEPKMGQLKPNESTKLLCSFIPYKKKAYRVKIPIEAFSISDDSQNLVGFHFPGSGKDGQEKMLPREKISNFYEIELHGAGADGSLKLEPATFNFDIVKVNFTKKETVRLINNSNCTFFIQLNLRKKSMKKYN